jgi:pyruvate/2-oxoglutarate dehydrogenase complex dihydrolipoamide dehydrogenase (E3) component
MVILYGGFYWLVRVSVYLIRNQLHFLDVLLSLLLIWFITGLAIRISRRLIDRFITRWNPLELIDFLEVGDSQRRHLRTSTIAGAMKGLVTVVILLVGVLSAVDTLGLSTASVIAVGSLAGLAITFGSQNLVKDLVNGFLILAEDQYAIGDVIPTPALAHTASAEGMHAVEVIAGHKPPVIDYSANPNAIYTSPEIASIGRTEQALKAAKVEYKVAQFPFAPMARAKIDDATEGFVKIIYEPKYRELLGVHIIGAKATEMIAEFALGKVLETTVDEIAHTIHPHPTISETIMEAAHVAMGGAIHL